MDQAGNIICVTSKTSNLQPGKLCILLKSEEHGWVRIQATLRVDDNHISSSKGSKGDDDYDGSESNGSNSNDNHSNASEPTKEPGCGDDDEDSTDNDDDDSSDDNDDDSADDDDNDSTDDNDDSLSPLGSSGHPSLHWAVLLTLMSSLEMATIRDANDDDDKDDTSSMESNGGSKDEESKGDGSTMTTPKAMTTTSEGTATTPKVMINTPGATATTPELEQGSKVLKGGDDNDDSGDDDKDDDDDDDGLSLKGSKGSESSKVTNLLASVLRANAKLAPRVLSAMTMTVLPLLPHLHCKNMAMMQLSLRTMSLLPDLRNRAMLLLTMILLMA